ncbi:MAG: MucB/RseB C-terminal domain-containing protein [Ectothiorhodospiraceae bacterium]
MKAISKRPVGRPLAALTPFAVVGLWLFFSASVFAADKPSARDLLERMTRAVRAENYVGVFVYRYGSNLEAMRIVHRADGDGERERLFSLNGAAREIIRDDARVTCILPDNHSVVVDSRQTRNPLNRVLPGDLEEMSRVYDLSVMGTGRVAGRKVYLVSVAPKDSFRYGYRLSIDSDTGLLLRSDLLDGSGNAVEQVMFTDLSTPEKIPDAWLESTVPGDEYTWYRNDAKGQPETERASGWNIEGVPDGFRLVLNEKRPMPGSEGPVEHRLYSDGLASVSVYIERKDDHEAFTGSSRMGAVNAFGRVVSGYQTVVVGEVPAATVRRIGQSIARSAGDGDGG